MTSIYLWCRDTDVELVVGAIIVSVIWVRGWIKTYQDDEVDDSARRSK